MESRLQDIRGANGEVLGISADSPFTLGKWAEQEGYTFPLLSDFGKETIQAYDVMYPSLVGLKGVPKRSAFLIDKDGKLVRQEVCEDAKVLPDLDGFISTLQSLA